MLFLDSASLEDARAAAALRLVHGVTTNPALFAATRGGPVEDLLRALADIVDGTIFYQLTGETLAERDAEARWIALVRPGRIGLKVPCTIENLGLVSRLNADGLTCGITTIFSASQVLLAVEAGARYVFPYVNRTTRLYGDGIALVHEMRDVVDSLCSPLRIVAASVKTADEAVASILAGAHGLTLPLVVLESLAEHPGSRLSIEEFQAISRGIPSTA
jgi:transaldolase